MLSGKDLHPPTALVHALQCAVKTSTFQITCAIARQQHHNTRIAVIIQRIFYLIKFEILPAHITSRRDIRLCLGHHLQHSGFALSVRGECAVDRGCEFCGRIHALCLCAQPRAHLRVIPAQLIAPKAI